MKRMRGDDPKNESFEVTRIFNRFLALHDDREFGLLVRELLPKVRAYVEGGGRLRDPAVCGDDVALSVFRGLYLRAANHKLKTIDGRWQLWVNLKQWADQKVISENRKADAERRPNPSRREGAAAMNGVASQEPDPADQAALQVDQLFRDLERAGAPAVVSQLAMLGLLGFTEAEIRRELQIGKKEYDLHICTIKLCLIEGELG